jgi:hypothetical protein
MKMEIEQDMGEMEGGDAEAKALQKIIEILSSMPDQEEAPMAAPSEGMPAEMDPEKLKMLAMQKG